MRGLGAWHLPLLSSRLRNLDGALFHCICNVTAIGCECFGGDREIEDRENDTFQETSRRESPSSALH
jgi:hypothetical protein